MVTVTVFEDLNIHVSDEDWAYMCENRFFSSTPDPEHIRAEFVTGTGITSTRRELWPQADKMFSEYVQELKMICGLDINAMARDALTDEER